ncbi:MAG TPA: hypothetical protein VGN72_01630 [Tepidisphaeraceae bacterium]|nr:hypothetical protein [Tepidisphaeraceae bacterium]
MVRRFISRTTEQRGSGVQPLHNQTLQWTGPASGVLIVSKSIGAVPAIERWSVMSPEAATHPNDPTRAAWLDKMRPGAERAIANVWKPQHSAFLLWTTPRAVDRKGRLTSGTEKKDSRLRAFDEVRAQVLKLLASGDFDAARSLAERSEFAHAMRVAFNPDEAAARFAEFLVSSDNAWCEGDAGERVLWICSWRE